MRSNKQPSLYEGQRFTLKDSIQLSLDSLREYGQRYRHWSVAYSGGKDSSSTVTFIAWAILTGQVDPPNSLIVMYADTRQELIPLAHAAALLLQALRDKGIETQVVLPELDDRFYVYMFGRGVPPPSNTFRWCTSQLKIEPMERALEQRAVGLGLGEVIEADGKPKYQNFGEKMLIMTGVRIGESAARDARIAVSCSKDSGECGQGWFYTALPENIADTLAPLLHWRLCHVFDWLYFYDHVHGFPQVGKIADVYGEDEVRTGCVGCNLASRDTALLRLLDYHDAEWGYLRPLLEIKPMFAELKKPGNRKRKSDAEYRKDGTPAKNIQRLGPLTMKAREWGLNRVLEIQDEVNAAAHGRPTVDLINREEETRIRELWSLNTWPNGWSGDELVGSVPIDAKRVTKDGRIVVQGLLVR